MAREGRVTYAKAGNFQTKPKGADGKATVVRVDYKQGEPTLIVNSQKKPAAVKKVGALKEDVLATVQKDARIQKATSLTADLVKEAQELQIIDSGSEQHAVMTLGVTKAAQKDLKSLTDLFVAPLQTQVRKLQALFVGPKDSLQTAESLTKQKLSAYKQAQEEAERLRLLELNKRELRAAKRSGGEAEFREEVREVARSEVGKSVTAGETKVIYTERPDVSVEDFAAVPDAYKVLDRNAALAAWRAASNAPGFEIPGLKFGMKKVLQTRT